MATNKYIVLLGRPPARAYSVTRYWFRDDALSDETSFFFLALWRWLEAQGQRPDDLLLIGTADSAWSSLQEFDPDLVQLDYWAEIEGREVDQQMLAPIEAALTEQLKCGVQCLLIPDGTDPAVGDEMLRILTANCGYGDTITLDVTHGYRSYGLLAVQIATYLRQVRGASVGGVWYGQFGPHESTAVRLGVDDLATWSEALATMRHTGRLTPVAQLLPDSLGKLRELLEEIDFAINASRFGNLTRLAGHALSLITRVVPRTVDVTCELALNELRAELEPYHQQHLADVQLELAKRALETGDHLRAAILLYEAVCSASVGDPGRRLDYRARSNGWDVLMRGGRQRGRQTRAWVNDGAKLLADVRNSVAHGSRPANSAPQQVMRSAADLSRFLHDQLKQLRTVCEELKQDPPV